VKARKEAIQAGKGMAGRPWRLSARLLIACSALTMVGFSAICGNVMLDMRRGDVELARQSLDNLASGVDADIGRNIELYDNSLRAVASSMVQPEIKDISQPIRHLILFGHAATARHFGAIQVFDRNGQLTNDASTLDPAPENRADEDYFGAHRDRPDAGLFISHPMLHRGTYAIVLSRRITGADGSFLGVVAGSIRFSYFHDLFGRLNLSPDDMIAVLRRDGTVIMRTPFDLDIIGRNLVQLPAVAHALSETSGSYSGPGEFDSVARLLVWRDSRQPLVVLVGKPWDQILSIWHREAIRIGAIMAALVAFALAATLVLAREIRRRGEAEDKLEELATTDALTGLRNRRKFDAAIDSEWRRAARHGTPVSLLMIDADHFKAYNDTFGHQAGDQVLVGIAICISDSIKRAGDCAARYGGEEFAVLLPGLSATEALAIAEIIRHKVEGWSDDATPSTVSIGIASMIPAADLDWPPFVHAADKALYAAKAAGRNRCVIAAMPALSLAA
jgi:diguanylate cyclase (GGDEF)-like protein